MFVHTYNMFVDTVEHVAFELELARFKHFKAQILYEISVAHPPKWIHSQKIMF